MLKLKSKEITQAFVANLKTSTIINMENFSRSTKQSGNPHKKKKKNVKMHSNIEISFLSRVYSTIRVTKPALNSSADPLKSGNCPDASYNCSIT